MHNSRQFLQWHSRHLLLLQLLRMLRVMKCLLLLCQVEILHRNSLLPIRRSKFCFN